MALSADLRRAVLVLMVLAGGSWLHGQTASAWKERLVGHPLYLRGFWMGDKLEFDAAGQLLGTSSAGPVTLSGVDVKDVVIHGERMSIRGQRVGLVADDEGRLQRSGVHSTTLIVPSLRRGEGHKYTASEEISLTLHADPAGNFDTAVRAVFADGLKELATSVPAYWSCYAEGFFAHDLATAEAEKLVADCVRRRSLAPRGADSEAAPAPQVLRQAKVHLTDRAAELGAAGASRVHFTVSEHGLPVGFQIVQAVGAGMDEALLTAVYQSAYLPATRDGRPVAADTEVCVQFNIAPW